MSIANFMHHHHVHCDDLFVAAEEACHAGNWTEARSALDAFVGATEMHFSAEEDALFPAFEQATGMTSGPTQMMRMEHHQMRGLFEQMKTACDAKDGEGFAGAAETLLVLMQQHNMKEENILYPMCDQALPPTEIEDALRGRLEGACPA